MILPGAASVKREVSVAWCAARKRSTPRASDGSSHKSCMAVTMASRPNAVENQGMPA